MSNIFFDIGIIMISATILGFIGRLLKQPLIPIYILAGVIIGPIGLGLITDSEIITTLSEIGIAFLLFVVGLELDLKKLKDVGNVIIIGSIIQIISIFFVGLLVGGWLGFTGLETVYLGLIVTFSSTMVVIKLLSDKNELDTLHGRIIIGILLMQDIFAILALSSIQTINNFSGVFMIEAILKASALILIAYVASKYVFSVVFKQAAKSQEILFLISITICFAFGMVSVLFGLSMAIGGFLAGVALANLPYNLEIAIKVRSLRDFFATIFFVSLGMKLLFTNIGEWILPLIIFTFLILFFKPLLTLVSMSFFGYKKKTSFMTSISLAQISEFSLIIVAQGAILGHIGQEFMSLTTMLAIITIIVTTYLIKFDNKLYTKIKQPLRFFDRLSMTTLKLEHIDEERPHKAILIGYDRMGFTIAKSLERLKKDFIIIDFNPEVIKKLIKREQPCLYGDIGDVDILEKLRLEQVEIVISTIPDMNAAQLLIKKIKEHNSDTIIIVSALGIEDALKMYDKGADYVIVPHLLGGHQVSIMLEDISYDIDKLVETKLKHIQELKERSNHRR